MRAVYSSITIFAYQRLFYIIFIGDIGQIQDDIFLLIQPSSKTVYK